MVWDLERSASGMLARLSLWVKFQVEFLEKGIFVHSVWNRDAKWDSCMIRAKREVRQDMERPTHG